MRCSTCVLGLGLSWILLGIYAGTAEAQPAPPDEPSATSRADGADANAADQPAPMIPIVPEAPPPAPPPLAPTLPANPGLMSINPAAARPSLVEDRSAPPFDWMAPAGGASLGIGAVLALSSAIELGTKGGGQQCGRDGCVDRPDYLADNTGASLLGAGAGFMLVGGVTLLTGLTVTPGLGERRKSPALMVTGLGLTALSAAGLGLGIAEARTYDPGRVDFTTAWPSLVGSAIAGGVGIPFLVVGAAIETPQDRERERAELAAPHRGEQQNVGMVVAGAILTGTGALAGLVGTGIAIFGLTEDGDFAGFTTLLIGLPLVGAGGIFDAIGVPLLCAGLRHDPVEPSAPPAWATPEVQLGPTGFTSTWRF